MGAGRTGRGIWPGTYPLTAESQGFAVASGPILSLLLSLILSLPSRAFSSKKLEPPFRFNRNGKGSRLQRTGFSAAAGRDFRARCCLHSLSGKSHVFAVPEPPCRRNRTGRRAGTGT